MGLKMDWWDHRIRINPSIYYYDYKNIQVAHRGRGGRAGFLRRAVHDALLTGVNLEDLWML